MKRFILLFTIFIMVISCKRDPLPKNAIPREKFVDVLVDVHIAEGIYRERKRIKMDSLESAQMYQLVLDKYNITEDELYTTVMYYTRNQKEYDKIYGDVLSKISILIEEENENNEYINRTPPTINEGVKHID